MWETLKRIALIPVWRVPKPAPESAIPVKLWRLGWWLCPGVILFVWRMYSDAYHGYMQGFYLLHDQPLLFLWWFGSWMLAHLWLLVVAGLLAWRYERRGWTEKAVQLQVAVIVSLLFLGYLAGYFASLSDPTFR
jgi:hypothetical protein